MGIYLKDIDGNVFFFDKKEDATLYHKGELLVMTDSDVSSHLGINGSSSNTSKSIAARFARNDEMSSSDWLVSRHIDEIGLGVKTSITPEEYDELLSYRKSLRDWPSCDGWPNIEMPKKPSWMN